MTTYADTALIKALANGTLSPEHQKTLATVLAGTAMTDKKLGIGYIDSIIVFVSQKIEEQDKEKM